MPASSPVPSVEKTGGSLKDLRISRTTGQAGIELIKTFEGLTLKAYKDVVGIWTIGYGHTGPEVKEGLTLSSIEEAEQLLRKDLGWAEEAVNQAVKVPLTQNQFDALVCFTYNIGGTKFTQSTLCLKINAKDYRGAADEFLRWNRAGGQIITGLTRRRKAEQELFLK